MLKILKALPFAAPMLLGACATPPAALPVGPSVLVLPGADKPFEQFVGDDAACGRFAAGRSGGSALTQAAAAGDPPSSGKGDGRYDEERSAVTLQEAYDIGYLQCMYAKGHRVPIDGQVNYESQLDDYPPPPPPPPVSSMPPSSEYSR